MAGKKPFYRDSKDVHGELSKWLNREPDREIWKLLVEDRYPGEVINGFLTMKKLVDRYRRLEQLRGGSKRRVALEKDVPPDQRGRALSEIMALSAARRPDVQEYREKFLGNNLLTTGQAPPWIEEQFQKQGPPTRFVAVPVPEGADYQEGGFGWLKQAASLPAEERMSWPVKASVNLLAYSGPDKEHVSRVPTAVNSPLERLRVISEDLSKAYGWHPAQATIFVLTGLTPMLFRARITTETGGTFPAKDTIRLEVRLGVSVREVVDIYAEVRRELLGPGRRDPVVIQKWRADLAVFAAEHNDGRSWREAMETWNKLHPERQGNAGYYNNPSTFARDARQAYEKITGARLIWGQQEEVKTNGQ